MENLKNLSNSYEPNKKFHEVFPLTLEYLEGKNSKICYFQCQEHLDKYLTRYNLKKQNVSITKTKPRTN
jgi:hypothetical protein